LLLLLLLVGLCSLQQPLLLPHLRRQRAPRAPVALAIRIITLLTEAAPTVAVAREVQNVEHVVALVVAANVCARVAPRAEQAEGKSRMVCAGGLVAVPTDGEDGADL
jgi:hypothetical protein